MKTLFFLFIYFEPQPLKCLANISLQARAIEKKKNVIQGLFLFDNTPATFTKRTIFLKNKTDFMASI